MARPATRTAVIDCDCAKPYPHGDPHTYRHHLCGCAPCREANRVYQRNGVGYAATRVPAQPIRERVLLLRERGVSSVEIARRLGQQEYTLHSIAAGQAKTVAKDLADAILAIPVPDAAPTPAPAPIVRRAAAPAVCNVDGCEDRPRGRGMCSAHYHRAWRAARRGAAVMSRVTSQDRLDELLWLMEGGVPLEFAAPRVGWRPDTAREHLKIHRPDLWERITRMEAA